MNKTIINIFVVFLLSLSMVTAAELVGTFDSFVVDSDYSDSTYVAQTGARAVYLHTYPVSTDREWYDLYVTASDPISQTCDIEMVLQNGFTSGPVTISENEVYKFVENSPFLYQYLGVSGFTGGGTCRVAYSFLNTNFGPLPGDVDNSSESEVTENVESCTDSDGGSDYYTQGTMTHLFSENSLTTNNLLSSPIVDYCINDSTVMEHFCADGLYGPDGQNFIHQYAKQCENGCVSGACLEELVEDDLDDEDNSMIQIEDTSSIEELLDWLRDLLDFSDSKEDKTDTEDDGQTDLTDGIAEDLPTPFIWVADEDYTNIQQASLLGDIDEDGPFLDELSCPDGYVVKDISTTSSSSGGDFFPSYLYSVTLDCVPSRTIPFGSGILDFMGEVSVSWGAPSIIPTSTYNIGYFPESNGLLTGLSGEISSLAFLWLRNLEMEHTIFNEAGVSTSSVWVDITSSNSDTFPSPNDEIFCPPDPVEDSNVSVTGISGLMIYSEEILNSNLNRVTGFQLMCTRLVRE